MDTLNITQMVATIVTAISMVALAVITWIYARRTHDISKATKEQAEATRQLAETAKREADIFVADKSREHVKELITTVIYPLLDGCTKAKRQLDTNNFAGVYFAGHYVTGWPTVSGSPRELDKEEAKALSIGTSGGQEVFSFPDPSLGIVTGRYLTPDINTTLLYTVIPRFEDEHKNIADQIAKFDSNLPQLYKLLRSLAVEVKNIVTPYVNNTIEKGLLLIYSDSEKGHFVSYVTEICFNHLLMTKEFPVFLRDFKQEQAKKFWEENKEDLQTLLNNSHLQEEVARIRGLSSQLSTELAQVCSSLETLVEGYRSKCYITIAELPPFLS